MDALEQALTEHHRALERYVRFRISNPTDAEDVLQEVYSAAAKGITARRSNINIKPWLVGIARNKCADYFRRKYRQNEVPLADAGHIAVLPSRFGVTRDNVVLYWIPLISSAFRISKSSACATSRSFPSKRSPGNWACPSAR